MRKVEQNCHRGGNNDNGKPRADMRCEETRNSSLRILSSEAVFCAIPQKAFTVADTKLQSPLQGLTSGRCPPQNHRSRCELCKLLHPPLPVRSDSSSSGSTAEFHTQGTELGLCSCHHLIWDTSVEQKNTSHCSKKEWLKSWQWLNLPGKNYTTSSRVEDTHILWSSQNYI